MMDIDTVFDNIAPGQKRNVIKMIVQRKKKSTFLACQKQFLKHQEEIHR